MEHYQAGGAKPSHFRTPRMSSDGSFTEGHPSARQSGARIGGWMTWSGWIAFALLLLVFVAGK